MYDIRSQMSSRYIYTYIIRMLREWDRDRGGGPPSKLHRCNIKYVVESPGLKHSYTHLSHIEIFTDESPRNWMIDRDTKDSPSDTRVGFLSFLPLCPTLTMIQRNTNDVERPRTCTPFHTHKLLRYSKTHLRVEHAEPTVVRVL